MSRQFSGAARVAGVIGYPVRQSLSPLIHMSWIAELGLDAAYVPLSAPANRFATVLDGLRFSGMAGVNVTLPFKEEALRLADEVDELARAAGSANRLLFRADGSIHASNTDGVGLLAAFAEQAPQWRPDAGPVLLLGAGGAARGAAAALTKAGAAVRLVNRTAERAQALAASVPGVEAWAVERLPEALPDVTAVINATSAGLEGQGEVEVPFDAIPSGAVVMDMVYKPLATGFLRQAKVRGHPTVDGLAMLIGQARPSFEAFFGQPPPPGPDVRRLALQALGEVE
jgi:shikimate dehydrogenase